MMTWSSNQRPRKRGSRLVRGVAALLGVASVLRRRMVRLESAKQIYFTARVNPSLAPMPWPQCSRFRPGVCNRTHPGASNWR